jgi:acetyltransferase-like isoleucine patch superfamily enzyme
MCKFYSRLGKLLRSGYWFIMKSIFFLKPVYLTRNTQTPITLSMWFLQQIMGFNRGVYWQVHFTSRVSNWKNIYAGIETSPGMMPGCYIQGFGKIFIGNYTQISCNVGIISANHDLYNNSKHIIESVDIGQYCWIGMNAVILPGVKLGDFTIVGAGSIVTNSFPEGYCVIAGNPARLIKRLDPKQCVCYRSAHEYNGYIPNNRFEEFRKRKLNV